MAQSGGDNDDDFGGKHLARRLQTELGLPNAQPTNKHHSASPATTLHRQTDMD